MRTEGDIKLRFLFLILQTDMAAGHFSQPGIYDYVREEAFHFAFIIWALSACPDGLGGESRESIIFHMIIAIIGAGVVLAMAGKSWTLVLYCALSIPYHEP